MAQTPQVLRSQSGYNVIADFDSIRALLLALTTQASRAAPLDHVCTKNITPTIGQAIEAIITSQQALKWMQSCASRKMISHSDPAAFQTCLEKTQQLIVQAGEQVSQSRAWIAWFEAALNETEAIPKATAFP
jgi:hypothetical protein